MVTGFWVLTPKPRKVCLVYTGFRARRSSRCSGGGGGECADRQGAPEHRTRSRAARGCLCQPTCQLDGESIPGSVVATMAGKISYAKNFSVASYPTDRMTNIAKMRGAHV